VKDFSLSSTCIVFLFSRGLEFDNLLCATCYVKCCVQHLLSNPALGFPICTELEQHQKVNGSAGGGDATWQKVSEKKSVLSSAPLKDALKDVLHSSNLTQLRHACRARSMKVVP